MPGIRCSPVLAPREPRSIRRSTRTQARGRPAECCWSDMRAARSVWDPALVSVQASAGVQAAASCRRNGPIRPRNRRRCCPVRGEVPAPGALRGSRLTWVTRWASPNDQAWLLRGKAMPKAQGRGSQKCTRSGRQSAVRSPEPESVHGWNASLQSSTLRRPEIDDSDAPERGDGVVPAETEGVADRDMVAVAEGNSLTHT